MNDLRITPLHSRRLLTLVRAALWHTDPDPSCFVEGDTDWDAIRTLAIRQTVNFHVYMSAMSLPDPLRPPKKWILTACADIERNRRTHHLMDRCVVEAVGCLTEAGLSPVLLKGQAYARHYSEPYLRHCGDIDLYIGGCDHLRAYEAVMSAGWQGDGRPVDSEVKHSGCYLHGIHVELHRVPALLSSPAAQRRFEEWSRTQLLPPGSRTVDIAGTSVAVPTPLFDVVFVFLHLYHHFINGGVGLRQICDWTMLLHANAGGIDTEELEGCLKDFKLFRAWRTLTPIAVDILGLPGEECPFYSPEFSRKAEKIMGFIMREGNFGKYAPKRTPRPKGYWRGKLHSFLYHRRRLLSLVPIDPPTAMRNYLRYFSNGWKRILDDFTKKKMP